MATAAPRLLLPEMVRMWRATGADIVQAVKRTRGQESVSSKASALLFYVLLKKFSDSISGVPLISS